MLVVRLGLEFLLLAAPTHSSAEADAGGGMTSAQLLSVSERQDAEIASGSGHWFSWQSTNGT